MPLRPANTKLFTGEANLPKPGVVNVSQLFTVDKSDLVEKIGTLSLSRMRQVLDEIDIVLQPREIDYMMEERWQLRQGKTGKRRNRAV